jgi:hypothetical protein
MPRYKIIAAVNCLLAATERNSEGGSGIVPARDAFFGTHHAAGSAFQASGVLEVDLIILQPVAAGRAHNQTDSSLAGCADCLVDDNVRMTFVHAELVER